MSLTSVEDIVGTLEIVSIEAAIQGTFFKDNPAIKRENDECTCPAGGNDRNSINITVSAMVGIKETRSQVEAITEGGNDHGCICGSDDRYVVPISSGELITGGRDSDACKIVIRHPTISLVHFMVWAVKFDADSIPLVYLRDLSLNGVLLNGQQVGRNHTVLLTEGDTIHVRCAITFCFRSFYDDEMLLHHQPSPISTIEEWSITNRILGSGSFGSVFVAEKRDTKSKYAVKVIKNTNNSKPNSLYQERFKNEAHILLQIDHVSTHHHQNNNRHILMHIAKYHQGARDISPR